MTETRSFASLGPKLLARKGGARPAMRAQLGGMHPLEQPANHDDLGWNDLGEDFTGDDAGVVALTPAPANGAARAEAGRIDQESAEQLAAAAKPAVRRQQETIALRIAHRADAGSAPPRRRALEDGRRAAFTLRVDGERHLRLRLACTIRNRSAQQLVTEALDRLLAEMPELDALAAQVKRP